MAATSLSNARANRRVGLIAALAAIAMIGVAYASVPLYRLFCQVTGWGGTTQRAVEAPPPGPGKSISVRFDSNTSGGLPWLFRPEKTAGTGPSGGKQPTLSQAENQWGPRARGNAG